MHSFQIQETDNFKQCHSQYLNSAAMIDRKLQTIVGIEASNINILKQLKSLNEIVSDLGAANIQAFNSQLLSQSDLLQRAATNFQSENLLSPKSQVTEPIVIETNSECGEDNIVTSKTLEATKSQSCVQSPQAQS